MSSLPTKTKGVDAEGKHLDLLCVETLSLNRTQGRAAKEHFNPDTELYQGLSCTPLGRNCERPRRVGRNDGACCPCFRLLLLRACLHSFDLLSPFRQREDTLCGVLV